MADLTHLDEHGRAHMVDVGGKDVTERWAQASGCISMCAQCFDAVCRQAVHKGDVLGTARIAGIMAAKKTSDIIPLCHALSLSQVTIEFDLDHESHTIGACCQVRCSGRTGVEMEALTGVSAALLTIYDMCKALDRNMEMGQIHLDAKTGGARGSYRRQERGT